MFVSHKKECDTHLTVFIDSATRYHICLDPPFMTRFMSGSILLLNRMSPCATSETSRLPMTDNKMEVSGVRLGWGGWHQ